MCGPVGRSIGAVVLAALLAPAPAVAQAAGEAPPDPEPDEVIQPLDLGLTERTGRALMFLDVEAVDAEGRPLPGLTKEDFKIKLDYLWRELYSVDDLCPCSRDETPVGEGDPAHAAVGVSDRVFVLYFDFSALQLDGRREALELARRWLRETRQPDDQVMIVAYSSIAGLETRRRLTTDSAALLATLDDIEADPDMLDPFPSGLADRVETCRTGTLSCYSTARRDYFQTRRSLRTLMYFLTLLDDIPQRKVMLFFHQNNVIDPGTLYAGGSARRTRRDSRRGVVASHADEYADEYADEDAAGHSTRDGTGSGLVPDHLTLLGRLAGTATASRTAIHPIVSGSDSGWGVNFGANLADFTGGKYNRGSADAAGVVAAAGRGCACIYRLGLRAPERGSSKVYRTKIRAGDEILPSRYRLQYMTDYDRWERRAMAVLNSPQDARDLPIHAAVVPLAAAQGRWRTSVQVAFDLRALALVPEDGKWVGEWEVGALLSDARGRQTWEMLAVSRIQRKSDDPSSSIVLHERTFDDLAPGTYELRAFVRDRTANLFGGAAADIDLPDAGDTSMAGPLLMQPRQAHLRTGLPFLEGQRLDAPWQELESRVGSIPLDPHGLYAGRRLEFVTWSCAADAGRGFLRGLADASRELDLGAASVAAAGDCVAIRDEVDTSVWTPGSYTYRVHSPDAPEAPAERNFEISPAPAPK